MKTFLGVRWGMTYLFAPRCPNLRTQGHVFVSGGGKHVEDNMAARCGLPTEFYSTSAPCPDCAMMLYNKYKAKDFKPVIHIARPYQGKEKPGSKKANLHCLAMLMDAGFTIVPWSWVDFEHDYITNADCTEAINEMTSDSDSSYNMRYSKAMTTIQRAMDVMTWGHDHNYRICQDAASTVDNERYTEKNPLNIVNNERYNNIANNERYAAKNERYVANNVNNERYTAKGERYTANSERYTTNNERSPANDERYIAASNYVGYARYTANDINNERYVFSEQ